MIMWIIILALLFIGLALIIAELIFIPGTTVVGLLGLIFSVVGIVITYHHMGNDIGLYVLIGTVSITLVALFFSFRTGAWSRFSLTSSIEGRVNEDLTKFIKVGDEGKTLSNLRPMGKAEFHGKAYEVQTAGTFLDAGQAVKIVRIEAHQIIVEPLI